MFCAYVQFRNRLGGQVIVRRVVSSTGEPGAVRRVYRRRLGLAASPFWDCRAVTEYSLNENL